MGSPVSFPILCLFNAALTRFALEVANFGQSYMLKDLPMLINGDDLLCRTTPYEYDTWKEITRFGGLIPSMGKNFRSDTIGTINSEFWKFQVRSWEHSSGTVRRYIHMERKSIIQMGLMRGSMKNGTTTLSKAELSPFDVGLDSQYGKSKSECWREFLATCPNQNLAYDMLWKTIGVELTKILPKGMPLCQPIWLGGAGFPLPPDSHDHRTHREPSASQRMIARYAMNNPDLSAVRGYRRALGRPYRPGNLISMKAEEDRVRGILNVPGPKILDVDAVCDSVNDDFSVLPAAAFYRAGPIPESSEKVLSGEHAFSRLFARSRRCVDRPLPVAQFRDYPPQYETESFIFDAAVGVERELFRPTPLTVSLKSEGDHSDLEGGSCDE
jgi:hypothetical protein